MKNKKQEFIYVNKKSFKAKNADQRTKKVDLVKNFPTHHNPTTWETLKKLEINII
jgi:hypothetical protein